MPAFRLPPRRQGIFHDQSRPSLVGDGYLEISRIQGPSQQIADSYKDAKRYYTRSQSVAGSKPSSALKWVSLMVAAFFVFTYFVSRPVESQPASAGKQVPAQYSQQSAPVPQAPQQMQQPQPLAQQPSSSIATAEAASPVVPNEAHLSDDEKRVVSSIKNSFNIGSGSKAFYIFSDPNCPHCRRLESSLSHLPDGYHAIMVPVAYQAGSRDLAAKVMCSKDHAAAWKDASFSGVAAAAVCAKGLEMIDENNRIFESLRLTSTPSFVSPGGVLFSGFMSPDQLANLVKN